MADPLDVEDALIPPLARLRLRQVLGLQRDGFNLPRWDQNLLRAHQLGTVLHKGQGHGAEPDEYSSALICLTSFLHIVSACRARWVVGSFVTSNIPSMLKRAGLDKKVETAELESEMPFWKQNKLGDATRDERASERGGGRQAKDGKERCAVVLEQM